MSLRDRFRRTICDCAECVAACRHMPATLVPDDLTRIAAAMAVDDFDAWLLDHFEASPGPLVAARGELFRIPTIVPRLTAVGCIFLEQGRCKVHAVAPFGCAYADMHMGPLEGDAVSRAGLMEVVQDWRQDGPYSQAWYKLRAAGRIASPLEERRKRLEEAITKL